MPLDRKSITIFIAMFMIVTLVSGYVILLNINENDEENGQNTPPTSPVILIHPSPAYSNDSLTCTIIVPSSDAENDTITYTYEWKRNGSTTTIETNTVPSLETQVGDIWECLVTPFDGKDYGLSGSDTTIIQNRTPTEPENTPPSAPEVAIKPDPAYSNNTLTCTITIPSVDTENDSITYQYEWFRNESATGFTGANLSSIHTNSGDEWKCVVTPYDGSEYGPSGNDTIVIQDDGIPIPENTPPTAPEVIIGPDPAYSNSTLTCTITVPSSDADNDSITYIYEWFQNGTLTSETGESITSNQTGIGDEWKCIVTPFDGIEYGASGNDTISIQVDASGVYSLSQSISYTCAFGLVTLSYSTFTFVDTGTTLTVLPLMNGGGYMTGLTASDGNIDVTFVYFGSCDEYYTLTGDFTDENTWEATFSVSFIGFLCSDCTYQQWTVVGTRV
ncbi:MAG: hypothetical protein ACXABI_03690 [Candidatus Hodarchaeales archaeon]